MPRPWKTLFDAFLEGRSADMGERFVPFDVGADYRRYVDGKPRCRRDHLPKAHDDHVP